jgi:CRISPR-associated protein Cas1
MATLYLIEQNTILRKTSDRLRLCRLRTPHERKSHVTEGEVLLELPCADIDHVMVFGNVQVTTQALQELLQHGIELALFTFSGKLIGQLTPPKSKNILLRIEQFRKYQDENFRLQIAKMCVQRKIDSMLTILKTYKKHHPDVYTADELLKLTNWQQQVQAASATDSLLGFEGSASSFYFQLFGRMFRAPWKFEGRNRRPPKDPINAVLSFGYVIVGSEIQSLLDGIGFDPFLGFYHAAEYGRPSLALDLLEEYRHSFIDHLAIQAFNQGIFLETDFSRPPEGGVMLNTDGKKKFFQHYEKMAGRYAGATARQTQGFRSEFQRRIQELSKLVARDHAIERKTGLIYEDFDNE